MQGYDEAAKINKTLNHLLQENPVTKDNYLEWMKLTRTLDATCKVVNHTLIKPIIQIRESIADSL